MPRKPKSNKDYCKPGETLERGMTLSDPDFRGGRLRLDVFWTGSSIAPEITAACMPGDYLDVWPELDALKREKLRHSLRLALIRRLTKDRKTMTIINIDTAGDDHDQWVRDQIADHQGELIEYVAEGPGGGNPNWTIRFKDAPRARQFVREIYNDHGLTDAEIDELYIVKSAT